MAINSLRFIVSFFILLTALAILQMMRNHSSGRGKSLPAVQRGILLVYSWWLICLADVRFLLVIVAYTAVIYIAGRLLAAERRGKAVLTAGIVLSIVMLGYFKYSNFFLAGLYTVLGRDTVVRNIILPLGISFYTFSGMAYLIDVYRGEYEADRSFLNVALYMSFFAKLTAGPIVRGKLFLPQMKAYKGPSLDDFCVGVQIFVFGLFKKIVLADHLGVFVDDVFYSPAAFDTGTVILAVISYSLQIYFDFSGYSDMAIGLARMLGIIFDRNFNLPYIASGMSDFWKRWHISLSSWFQDYLYIPLGGSRKGVRRTYVNLLLVMAVSGLWHGAGITFVLWGFLYGIASCASHWLKQRLSGLAEHRIWNWLGVGATYLVVALFWVVFRAGNLKTAWGIYRGAFTIHDGIAQPYTWAFFAIFCLVIGTIAAYVRSRRKGMQAAEGFYPVMDLGTVWGLTVFLTFCGLTVMLGYFGNTAFIYGKF